MRSKLTGRYLHDYAVPIIVKVNGVDENWYYEPGYSARSLPVPLAQSQPVIDDWVDWSDVCSSFDEFRRVMGVMGYD